MFHVKQSDEFINFEKYLKMHVAEDKYNMLMEYFDLLLTYNKTINLFSRKNQGLVIKHFLDALIGSFKLDFVDKIVDIGSGNGLPGIVIAIMYPDTKIKIFERKERKSVFLKIVRNKLKLKNIEVYNESFDNNEFEDYSIIMKGVNPYDIKDIVKDYLDSGRVFYYSSGQMNSEIKRDYYIPVFNEKHAIIKITNDMLKDGGKWER